MEWGKEGEGRGKWGCGEGKRGFAEGSKEAQKLHRGTALGGACECDTRLLTTCHCKAEEEGRGKAGMWGGV